MNILGVESSCDETAVAVVKDGREILSSAVCSQIEKHAVYGGVVPEIASRCHVELVSGLCSRALEEAGLALEEIDAVAVSYAPGLIGALLVGLSFAKGLAYAIKKPLVPVHHIKGHVAANYLAFPGLEPPFICLSVSGGNSLILDVRSYTDIVALGSSCDDAAGECFDKVARVMGLPYPGGKYIDELSRGGDENKYKLPEGHIEGSPLDMSFSGLKTASINLIHNAEQKGEDIDRSALAASFTKTVSNTLLSRGLLALRQSGYKKLCLAGGVAANSVIRADFQRAASENAFELFVPPLSLCGDNAAMVAAQGYFELISGNTAGPDLNAYASMEL